MTYDVAKPSHRYNTDISNENYAKYRPEPEKKTIFAHWSILKGADNDMVLKTSAGAVNGSFAAITASLYANIRHTKGPFTLVGVAAKSFKHGAPWIVVGTTYGVTLSMLSQFRNKESHYHHMVAGYAAGTMLGTWYKWPQMGVFMGIAMAIAGGSIKYWHDNDMLSIQRVRRQRVFNMYRKGWFIDRPDAEGNHDETISLRGYKP